MVAMKGLVGFVAMLILVACIAVTGCTSADDQGSAEKTVDPSTPPAEVYNITDADAGKTIAVAEGSLIYVMLEENPTTGFEWNATVSEGISILSDNFETSDTSGQVVGAGGIRTWELVVSETGTQEFSAVYKRPWEETTGDEDTFEVTFTVA
jgi:inhibitor of cysteine peptidase